MEVRQRLLIGCLGALTPIITNLLVVDLNTTLTRLSVLEGMTYGIRLFALCAAACVVVYLNSDEERPVKLFQLGIMAPALLTSLINGAAISIKTTGQAPQGQTAALLPQKTEILALIGRAHADPAPAASGEASAAKDCLLPAELSTTQQIFKGLIGLVPDNKWYVVIGSYAALASANQDASEIRARFGTKYAVAVCKPLGGPDVQFRVVIGENLTYTDGTRLKLDAIAAGLPNSTWLWNPVDMVKAIQR
ncbi:hypothetical protein PMI42_02719 [Bradyrhizobium sp. YR681]|uniref:hypothetical protein n=1 Tax=Bradyrhizobium sp. YR681 TaxID=1144344 RepID=UPI000270F617|nr:hypothetical protein [Bradyrhizobium sp. YR681]EJN13733.1 hypothetical protein PMI42_02719 [Bradyrhizobium sp. YR681]